VGRLGAACLAAFAAANAAAQPPVFGDGHNGTFVVSQPATILNSYAQLGVTANQGSTLVQTKDMFLATQGDLVLFWISGMESDPDAGSQVPIDLQMTAAGRFTFARVTAVSGRAFQLDGPLPFRLPALTTQVVLVPEYSSITVNADAGVVPQPWNGATGGIVAFLASEKAIIDGTVTADGAGFRGGIGAPSTIDGGCDRIDEPPPGGNARGEGVAPVSLGPPKTGRGNIANGGGGGICDSSGGGGGGHRGRGGTGGKSAQSDGSRPVGGLGGVPLIDLVGDRVTFGGGGGAGNSNQQAVSGGNGGGFVHVAAPTITGRGRVTANGAPGLKSPGSGSGGGAGGTVVLQFSQVSLCPFLAAQGGLGGDSSDMNSVPQGPGGGGSGGLVRLVSPNSTPCPAQVSNGVAGKVIMAPGLGSYGATPTAENDPPSFGQLITALLPVTADDAGVSVELDAGVTALVDAGMDAGLSLPLEDAGTPDMESFAPTEANADEELAFSSCGCSSIEGFFAVAGLLLLRRREP
jgi:hypothetical protein